ncbi:MAG: choice-of-anchor D domain-containing protein [Acidobacteria bacterium]|nr:choice-of-anchor D domain-containing protein [Acidobacteriota bacterium]
MTRYHSLFILGLIALCALAPVALAQAPFSIGVQLPQTTSILADGGTLALQADALSVPVAATLTVSYTGANQTFLVNAVDLTGATDFSMSGAPDLSQGALTYPRTQKLVLGVRYSPRSSVKVAGKINIAYSVVTPAGTSLGALTLNLTGVVPEFTFSYIAQGGNPIQVGPGDTMTMALTAVDATSNTVVVVTNKGSGPGVINGVSNSGSAFSLVGLPLPQTSVDAGKELRFTVAFTPRQLEPSAGALQVALFDKTVSFNLVGEGSGPEWAYETIQESTISAILAGQPISLPDAAIGEKSSITVRVTNVGNAEGRITAINVSGAGFTLTDQPFTPLTLQADASATVTVTFTPTQAGRVSGRLRIGPDSFEISGNGLGSVLQYAYAIGSASITVQNNGQVAFTPVAVGRTSNVRFTVNNTGTAPASIGSISIVQTGTVFALTQLPELPVTIQPGGMLSFQLGFTPTTMGASAATLKLDNTLTFTLSGTGNTPAALPDYRFEGPSGPQEPLAQPTVALALAQAYPLALNGTLTLNFYSEVGASDPAVQFATGGRTTTFIIPANSTRAIFPNNATQIRVQTGSVAGAITLTPSFQTTEGKIDLTPINPPSFSIAVPQLAPRLLGVSITGKTASGFTLLVTGLATGRSVTQMDIQFTPVANETVATTKVTLPVESSFLAWFASPASQAYGSLFTASVPFTMQGDVNKVTNVVDTLQSLSVTISNRLGTTAAQSVSLK